jgi:CRISPR system Cascade subunit CasB
MSEPKLDPRVIEFCERLSQLDPGDRARLKRNAGRTLSDSHKVMGLFFRLLPPNVPRLQEDTYFMIATLYPLAESCDKGNLGNALRQARDPKYAQGLDRRIQVLLDANQEQLAFRLRQAIHFLHGQRVPVNWPRLLHDLLRWDSPKRYVQEQWARTYFASE